MQPVDRLIFALDVPSLIDAREYARILNGHVGAFKIGLELFCRVGPTILLDSLIREVPILLDLKLHDIPETVRRTALQFKGASLLGITVHASGGMQMLEAAVSTGVPIYAVTVLTSMNRKNLEDEGLDIALRTLVFNRARIAKEAGCAGLIASPLEAEALGAGYPDMQIVTPGIRPAGKEEHDQKRSSTPRMAIKNGADRIVVGRSIRDDDNPGKAAIRIVEEIEQGLEDRL